MFSSSLCEIYSILWNNHNTYANENWNVWEVLQTLTRSLTLSAKKEQWKWIVLPEMDNIWMLLCPLTLCTRTFRSTGSPRGLKWKKKDFSVIQKSHRAIRNCFFSYEDRNGAGIMCPSQYKSTMVVWNYIMLTSLWLFHYCLPDSAKWTEVA